MLKKIKPSNKYCKKKKEEEEEEQKKKEKKPKLYKIRFVSDKNKMFFSGINS